MPSGLRSGLLSRLLLAALVLGSWCRPPPALAQEDQGQEARVVALELVLLVDVSASVDSREFRLQAAGLAAAFRSSAVLDAIGSLAGAGIAVIVIQWGDESHQSVAVDWSHIRRDSDALRLASRVGAMPRLIDGGHTALGSALTFAAQEIDSNGFAGLRQVIDLAGDGRNNSGRPLRTVRREIIAKGITINGLAIRNEIPLLDRYFRDYLIGGDGAFYIVAEDYGDFAEAMVEKLVREIRSVPLSQIDVPNSPDAFASVARAKALLARRVTADCHAPPLRRETASSISLPSSHMAKARTP